MNVADTINGETIVREITTPEVLALVVGAIFSIALIVVPIILYIKHYNKKKEKEQKLKEIGIPIICTVIDERRMRVEVNGAPLYTVTLEPIHRNDLKKYGTFSTTVKYRGTIFGIIPIGEKYLGKITTVLVNPINATEYIVEQERENPDMSILKLIQQSHEEKPSKNDTKPHQPTLNERLKQEGKELSIETQTIYKQLYPN